MKLNSATATAELGKSGTVQAWSGMLAGIVLLGLALKALHDYVTYEGDDPLMGVLLFVAVGLSVPGALGVVLGGSAVALRHRRPQTARTLASLSLVVVVIVIVGFVLQFSA